MKNDNSRVFKSRRTQRNYFVVGVIGSAALLAQSIWFVVNSNKTNNANAALLVSLPVLAIAVVFTLRSFRVSRVRVSEVDLEYRTMIRSQRFARSDIRRVSSVERYRGARRWSQPILELRDGRTVRLTEFSVPPSMDGREVNVNRWGQINENEFGEQQAMIAEINSWLVP